MTPLLLAACTSTSDPAGTALDALAAIERTRLAAAADRALASGALEEAAEAVCAGRSADPEGFAPLAARLDDRLAAAEPGAAAPAHAALYECAPTPAERRSRRDAALDAAARARYAPDQRLETRAGQAGVTRPMARSALDTLQEGYVDPLPDARLVAAAARRLAVLTDRPVSAPPGARGTAFEALWDEAVERGLPEETAVAELTEAAFSAADPWSMPVWPAQVRSWTQHHDGVRSGVVGVRLEDRDGAVVVVDLAEGGSAWSRGVHQGDRVLAVGGLTVGDAASAADALRGEDGTDVALTVLRGGERLDLGLTRGSVAARTVYGWKRTADGFDPFVQPRVALVRIAAFRPHTDRELEDVLPARDAVDAVVLDLRGNRGGDLEPALRLVDRFAAEGRVIGVEGRVVPEQLADGVASASPGDALEGVRLAVLVDAQTASSAEVVAGALQQLAGAVVVGERTAGKGTSQILRTDPAWSHALQYTNLVWTLPDGRRLHRADDAVTWGIEPDVPLALGPTARFVVGVMQGRREALVAHADGSPMGWAGAEVDPDLPVLTDDPQVVRALEAVAR